jgi:EmrB/QacA subfamily drug resistance transporter
MVIFDGAAVQMTLPVIQQQLGGTIQAVEWAMVAFLLLSTSTLLPFGRAGDVLGRERVYRAGILVFVLASVLCAVAPSLAWLVGARAAQGVGAAMTTANGAPILVDTFPENSGRMLGLGNVALALGMVAGPPVGALLTEAGSWRLIFVVAIPIGTAVWFATRDRLPRSPRLSADLDVGGGLISVLGLGSILVGVTFGHRWGWLSPGILASLLVGASLLTVFFVRESHAKRPILALSLVSQPMFLSGLLSSFFGYGSLFVALAALPYLLLVTQQRGIGESGLLVGILPLVLSLTAPVAGAVTDRIGSRIICTVSLLAMAAALVVILLGGSDVGTGRLLWALALCGAGLGGFEAPNDVDVLRSLPGERMGAGTALLGAVRNLGMTFGVAVGATLLDRAMEHASGTASERTAEGVQRALWVGAASAFIGAATALIRPKKASIAPA